MELSQTQKTNLKKQLKESYQKAFLDLLQQKVGENPPDYDWIVKLYKEIRKKLIFFLKKGSAYRISIEEGLDVTIFEQMLRNNAFKGIEFYNLVDFIFEKCLEMGSPARDNEVKKLKKEIIDLMKNNGTFAELVPLFIKNANISIDWIHDDMRDLKKNLSKTSEKKRKI